MAEVQINITAEDNATPVIESLSTGLDAVSGSLDSINSKATGLGEALFEMAGAWPSLAQALGALEIDVDTGALDSLSSELSGLDAGLSKNLSLDVSDALTGAVSVMSALDAIPDMTQKTVVIEYQTMASPVRPFTEGIGYIKDKMESLPTESTHTIRYEGVSGGTSGSASSVGSSSNISFSPTITISPQAGSGSGAELARALDGELARMWLGNRSELRRAIGQ